MRYPSVKSVKTIKTNKALTLNWDNTNKINFTDGGLLGAYLLQEIADALGKDINLLDARKIDPNSDREIKKNSIQIYEQA